MKTKTESKPFDFWHKPVEQSAGAGEKVKRFFYRCPSCLVVAALDHCPTPYAECDTCRCDKGAAHMEYMGRVVQDKLVREYDRPICDDRCTSARGPSCNCKCLGQNHGSHLWVTVTIKDDIPTVGAPRDGAKYKAQAEQFNAAISEAWDAIAARYPGDFERWQRGEWINAKHVWSELREVSSVIHKARKMREHHSRMKLVNRVLEQFGRAKLAVVAGAAIQASLF